MKKISITLVAFFTTAICFSQEISIADTMIIGNYHLFNIPTYNNYIVTSKYDTTVLNKGNNNCVHDFARQVKQLSLTSCSVLHDAAGCPNGWENLNSICRKCLLHINVKETRSVEAIKDEYEELLSKIKK